MAMSRRPAILIALAALSTGSLPARAEGRSEFVTCQAMVERAAQSAQGAQPDDATLARCRQIIRDWTLRESRMSVDEQGRPLR
jgi:hypothetical protein